MRLQQAVICVKFLKCESLNWKLPMNIVRFVITVFFGLLVSIPVGGAQNLEIPNFWDTNARYKKPDLSQLPRLRFLTTTDFPPFNFVDRDKQLVGFHVDLARAICKELDLLNRCEIQAVPWNELYNTIQKGQGEAILAGVELTKTSRVRYDFSRPYMHVPARFVVKRDSGLRPPAYDALFRKKVAVIEGSGHQKYFETAFANRSADVYPNRQEALTALEKGEVEAVFSDAVSLSFWLLSDSAKDCCVFLDGPFMSKGYFGNGMAVAVKKDQQLLLDGINYALAEVNNNGTFSELYLRYFPIGLF